MNYLIGMQIPLLARLSGLQYGNNGTKVNGRWSGLRRLIVDIVYITRKRRNYYRTWKKMRPSSLG